MGGARRGGVLAGMLVAVIATGVVALAAPSTAGAAVVFGSSLEGSATNASIGPGQSITGTANRTGSPFSVVAPLDGVLTEVRVRYSTNPANVATEVRFLILGGGGPLFNGRAAAPAGSDGTFVLPATPSSRVAVFRFSDAAGRAVGVPIQATERLAVSHLGESGDLFAADFAAGGGCAFRTGDPLAAQTWSACAATYEVLLQGTVEPDGDGDGYGDETQDGCPGTAGTSAGCIPATPPPPIVREVPVPIELPTFEASTNVSLALATTKIKPRKKFTVALSNTNSFAVKGSLTVATRDKYNVRISRRQVVQLASRPLSIAAGSSQSVRIGLPPELSSRLKKKKKLRLTLTATVRDPAGIERVLRSKPTLRAAK